MQARAMVDNDLACVATISLYTHCYSPGIWVITIYCSLMFSLPSLDI